MSSDNDHSPPSDLRDVEDRLENMHLHDNNLTGLRDDVKRVTTKLGDKLRDILLNNGAIRETEIREKGVYSAKIRLPNTTQDTKVHIVNPLEYAMMYHENYINLISGSTKALFVGMNPSRESPTGIPFYSENPMGECDLDADFLEWIRNDADADADADADMEAFSSTQLWKFIDDFVDKAQFFNRRFITNVCPLIFMKNGEQNSWKNISLEDSFHDTPESLLTRLLQASCAALKEMITTLKPEVVVAIGKYAENRVKEAIVDMNSAPKVLEIRHPASIRYGKPWQNPVNRPGLIQRWRDQAAAVLKGHNIWN